MKGYTEFKMENGLHVVLKRTNTNTVAGRLRVHHGALHEMESEKGLAHLLEHCIFTGGTENYSPVDVEKLRARIYNINASTGASTTSFPVHMLSEDTESYLDLVSEVAFKPRFDEVKFDEERKRVFRETCDDKSTPLHEVTKRFLTEFYGENSPHYCYVLGDENIVAKASSNDLRYFHDRGYSPNNMDLVMVGGLPDDIEDIVREIFSEYESGPGEKFEYPRNRELTGKKVIRIPAPELRKKDDIENSSACIYMALYAPTETEDDNYSADVMAHILGGDSNSRLFKTISQRMGAAYSIECDYSGTDNRGIIYMFGQIGVSHYEEVVNAVFSEMKKLREELFEEEVELIKRHGRYHVENAFETNSGRCKAITLKLDMGITPETFLADIDKVTAESVREAARKYLPSSREEGKYVLLFRDPLM